MDAKKLADIQRHLEDTRCPRCETQVPPATVMRCRDCGYIFPKPQRDIQAPPEGS